MKKQLLILVSALNLVVLPTMADTFNDATGDFTGGNSSLDITSVSVVNDATTLTFTINLAADPAANSWHNYYVGIVKPSASGGGVFNATGGWGKDIQMSSGGMDYVLASWNPPGSGASILAWDGASTWTSVNGSAGVGASSVTIPVALSALGLSIGDTIGFDVWTTDSGGDTVLDALSDSTSRSWNSNPFDTGANALPFTLVPEPGVCALLGLGALALIRRAVRRLP